MPTLVSGALTVLADRGIVPSVFSEEKNKELDKSKWENGEWNLEPDDIKWTDPETQFPCWIRRNQFGALCGYVGVPKGHPYFEKDGEAFAVSIHGGITFSDYMKKYNHWWLGFDCAHHNDLTPQFSALASDIGTYKNISYVINNILALVEFFKPENILENKIIGKENW